MQDLNLGVIGNCHVSALIDRKGRYVWTCWPRPDGDPVFCNLLDGGAESESGFFDIELQDFASTQRRYEDNSAILVTTLTDGGGGAVRITDFAPRFKQHDRTYRPVMFIRIVERIAGTPIVRIRARPRFDYGAARPAPLSGSNHIRFLAGDLGLRITTDAPVAYLVEETQFALQKPVHLIVGLDETVPVAADALANDHLQDTRRYWRDWSRYLSIPFEWQDAVIRAAITLKLCTFEQTGAVVAAMTTSIPEAAESGRNWDYRYCWLRDAWFVVQALNRLSATRTMAEYIRFIVNIVALEPAGKLRPLYGIVPGPATPERIVPSLHGYRGMGPVRVGNAAAFQVQHDVYGGIVLAAAQMFFDRRLQQQGRDALFAELEKLGELAASVALERDAGLWEYRERTAVHTFSAVMCWAACSRLARIAEHIARFERAAHWRGEADRLRAAILDRAWNPKRESFVESFGADHVDASLLLLQHVGFVAPTDPRFAATVAAIERDLLRGKRLLRYAVPDDFGAPTTAFMACTFWYINALAAMGRREEARAIFEDVLAKRNDLGLLSEDADLASGELWGNFPQAFSMVGLILSAMRLSKTWEEALWRAS
ncbi:MAG TPA: glycoside hydrolase family 15 protein [Alphaproteobacteria bacterium]|nr:glycoside hydrolase family 15 protein [Alphaproteobacteria bacterium]